MEQLTNNNMEQTSAQAVENTPAQQQQPQYTGWEIDPNDPNTMPMSMYLEHQLNKVKQEAEGLSIAYDECYHNLLEKNKELVEVRQSLICQKEINRDYQDMMIESAYTLIKNLSDESIASILNKINDVKLSLVIKHITNMNLNTVQNGIEMSLFSDKFNKSIDTEKLNDVISDTYNESQLVDLIDEKYSWHTLLDEAVKSRSIDDDTLVEYIDDKTSIINDEISRGNISFDELMENFDARDCYDWLSNEGKLDWSDVKEYIDFDDVKADIDVDDDMVTDYISNLSDSEFRTLISNIS